MDHEPAAIYYSELPSSFNNHCLYALQMHLAQTKNSKCDQNEIQFLGDEFGIFWKFDVFFGQLSKFLKLYCICYILSIFS
jgi:hypothetical protein